MTRRPSAKQPFGETITALMDETGSTYRDLAGATDLSAGYLNHIVHGNRPVPVERGDRAGSPRRSGWSPSTSASTASA